MEQKRLDRCLEAIEAVLARDETQLRAVFEATHASAARRGRWSRRWSGWG
jgi:hypothetical protein